MVTICFCTVAFDQFNASLLNKSGNFFKKKSYWDPAFLSYCIYCHFYVIKLVLSKDPVLRYQVGTKKMKTSRWYRVPGQPGSCCVIWKLRRCALFINKRRADIKRRKCIKLIKHFKDRHPDQMKYNPKSEKVGTVWKTQIKKESSDF